MNRSRKEFAFDAVCLSLLLFIIVAVPALYLMHGLTHGGLLWKVVR